MLYYYFFLFRFYLFIFREGKRGRERERNIDQLHLSRPHLGAWPPAQACALTGNHTSDLLVHRMTLNPEPHQPGSFIISRKVKTQLKHMKKDLCCMWRRCCD